VPKQAIWIGFASKSEGRMAEIRFTDRGALRADLVEDWVR